MRTALPISPRPSADLPDVPAEHQFFNLVFNVVGQFIAVRAKNLMPLSSYGLCEAVRTIPASARRLRVA